MEKPIRQINLIPEYREGGTMDRFGMNPPDGCWVVSEEVQTGPDSWDLVSETAFWSEEDANEYIDKWLSMNAKR